MLDGYGNSQLTIDNVDRSIVQAVRTISGPATVSAKIVLASNPDYTEAGPWDFSLRNVTYNRQQVSGQLIYSMNLHDYVSVMRFDTINFPGLFS